MRLFSLYGVVAEYSCRQKTTHRDNLRGAARVAASRGTEPEHSAKCCPLPTAPQGISGKSCRRGHTRHSQEAIREPKNYAARIRACRTGRKGTSIQPSMAKSSHQRTPVLRGPIHPSPQSYLPSWAFLTSSPPTRPDTAKSRKTVGRGIQNDLALFSEGFAVHWPLLRLCPCTFGTSRFPHTCRTEMPSDTPFCSWFSLTAGHLSACRRRACAWLL